MSNLLQCPVYLVADSECGRGHVRRLAAVGESLVTKGFKNIVWRMEKSQLDYDLPLYDEIYSIFVIDHYYFSNDVAKKLVNRNNLVLLFDDFANRFTGDLVVRCHYGNFSQAGISPVFLSGPRYFPICRDVVELAKQKKKQADTPTLFVPSESPLYADRKFPRDEFIRHIHSASILVTPISVAAYEALHLGTPVLATYVALNQWIGYKHLIRDGYVLPDSYYERDRLLNSAIQRASFAKAGQSLVDGQGANRIVSALVDAAKRKWNLK